MPEKWKFEGPGDAAVAVLAGAGAVVYVLANAKTMIDSWMKLVE